MRPSQATSQTICTSMLGTSAGIALASVIGQETHLALLSYVSMSSVHLYSAYRTVKCIPLASLNPTRLQLLLDEFFECIDKGIPLHDITLSSPLEIAIVDPPLFFAFYTRDERFLPRIDVGVDLHEHMAQSSMEKLGHLLHLFEKEMYMVAAGPNNTAVQLIIRDGATEEDALKGYMHAAMLRRCVSPPQKKIYKMDDFNDSFIQKDTNVWPGRCY